MKFFIASPWRNAEAVKSLSNTLAARGHVVYSFLDNGNNLATGKSVMEEFKQFSHSILEWDSDPLIKNIFDSEMKTLRDCDVFILLEPAGRSSLAEAGIAHGMGKRVVVVGIIEHPEIVYPMFESWYPDVEALLNDPNAPI
jgi:hypothetical protein